MSNNESDFPTEKKQSPEEQRQELIRRMNEATGGVMPELADVLSYFPEKAESFIKVQTYAAQVAGKKGVYHEAWHNERLGWDKIENLSLKGYTGIDIAEVLVLVDKFRGKTEEPIEKYGLRESYLAKISSILSAVQKRGEHAPTNKDDEILRSEYEYREMIRKALEVKGIKPEEVVVMKEYSEAVSKSRELNQRAAVLEQEAQQLRKQGSAVLDEAAQKIIQAREGNKK